jgi:hypothetical protein
MQTKLERLYEDRLEGRITEWYDRKAKELHMQAAELARKIADIAAAPSPVEDAIDLMDLTSRTAELFNLQAVPEQQRFLRLVLKSGTWKEGQLRTEFEEPFESLRRSNQLSTTKHTPIPTGKPGFQDWLLR